jgi:hypothetical protein
MWESAEMIGFCIACTSIGFRAREILTGNRGYRDFDVLDFLILDRIGHYNVIAAGAHKFGSAIDSRVQPPHN